MARMTALFLCVTALSSGIVLPALAQETPQATAAAKTAEMAKLREAFLEKIGKKMQEADLMMEGGNTFKLAMLRSGNALPDDETMIFRGAIGKDKIRLNGDIFAIVRDEKLMVSLSDFVDTTGLSITVSPEKGIATGWFIREDQDFFIDVNKNEYIIMGETGKLKAGEAETIDDGIFVNAQTLEKWFGIEINIDLNNLALQINTSQPFPIEERERRSKMPLYAASRTPAQLPLKEEPYALLSTRPYFDVSLSTSVNKPATAQTAQKTGSWALTGAGDFLGFSSKTFASGTLYNNTKKNAELIGNIRQTLSREDPDGGLLGPLNASEVAFGDISTVALPLGGGATTGLGVRASNKLFNDSTSLDSVDIDGDALPGWEVELFRNEGSLGLQTVGDDGRYLFPSVFLFAGNNELKLVFYGPQGEIREETREIFAGANIGLTGGKWDISAAAAKTQLYGSPAFTDATEGDGHLAASYEYSLGTLGTGRLGATSYTRLQNDTFFGMPTDVARKNIFSAGFSRIFAETLFSNDWGYDMDGAYATSTSLRRNFGKHMTGLVYSFQSKGFASSEEEDIGDSQNVQAFVNGPIAGELWGFQRPSYNVALRRRAVDGGVTTLSGSSSVSGRLGALGLSTGLAYTETEGEDGSVTPFEDRITGSVSATGRFDRGRWRMTGSYDVQPFELLAFNGQYTYPFSRDLEGVAEVRHTLNDELTELRLSANWLADKFTLSPQLTVDNQNNALFMANMRFGLVPDPYSNGYSMQRKTMTSNGGVASRVFLDVNGDGLYNNGEEMIEEAEVRALQSNRMALSDSKGVAFIPDLPKSRRTDVALTTNSLPDVFYVTLEEGRSVIPRPGITSKLDFPVVIAGEIDGEAGYRSGAEGARLARNVRIAVNAPTGKIDQAGKSEQDGYFTLSPIRPGFYYVTATPAPGSPPGYMLPVALEFGPQGSTYFGRKFLLTPGANVGFVFTSANQPPGDRKARVPLRSDIASQETRLRLGEYHSKVGLMVGWYKFRLKNPDISAFFNPVQDPSKIEADPVTGLMHIALKPNAPMTMGQGARICENLYHAGFACAVETITTYHKQVQSVEASGKPAVKPAENPATAPAPG